MKELGPKHRKFVEAYVGDTVQAMRLAGYDGADSYLNQKGQEFLSDPLIIEAIKERSKYRAKSEVQIMERDELMGLWSQIAKNEDPYRKKEVDSNNIPIPEGNLKMENRLKATEMLGKAQGVFVEKIDMNLKADISSVIMQSYGGQEGDADDLDLDTIEAMYTNVQDRPTMEIEPPVISEPTKSVEDFI